MDQLLADDVRTIKQMHSAWTRLERAGKPERLLDFCAPDIELHPPDGPVVRRRHAVLLYLMAGTARIHSINISNRQLHGSGRGASMTAAYKTTFSLPDDASPRQATGTHTWELRKHADRWLIVRISWTGKPSS